MKPKLTEELIKDLAKWISNGMNNVDACNLCGISETAFYGWIKKHNNGEGGELHAKLVESVKRAESSFKAVHTNNILQASKDKKHWQASAWLLERKYPKEYGRIDRNHVTVNKGNGVLDEILDMMKDGDDDSDE